MNQFLQIDFMNNKKNTYMSVKQLPQQHQLLNVSNRLQFPAHLYLRSHLNTLNVAKN